MIGLLNMFSNLGFAIAALSAVGVRAAPDLTYGDDSDLTSFVTRPEIKVPRLNVTTHSENVTPGYIFTAPYSQLNQQSHPKGYYQPCQTGPVIYDMNGELVWTGACQVRNQNAYDFRPYEFNGTFFTSSILGSFRDVGDTKGHGVVMDDSFDKIGELHVPKTLHNFNMHEFKLIDDGRKALFVVHRPWRTDLSVLEGKNFTSDWILDMGIREIDMTNGDVLFEWWAGESGLVGVSESMAAVPHRQTTEESWDWFHANSVEKSVDGDYLLSGRYTDTIYKISGQNGSLLWRLGGQDSSFVFEDGFVFARQHDARWISIEGTKEVISFLNNAADEETRNVTSLRSSAVVVELDTSTMTAKVLSRMFRPDQGLSRLRGNHQILDNKHTFACWSENSYVSEHSPDGKLLMEAQFASKRFMTYRAYKSNFTSDPTEPPVAKAFAFGTSSLSSTTVVYVSWNGATEVASWRFKSTDGSTIGVKTRQEFETMFQADGFYQVVFVEAVAANGSTIGVSEMTTTVKPPDWSAEPGPAMLALARKPILWQWPDSDGLLASYFCIATILMLCVGAWLWRCTKVNRSHVHWWSDWKYGDVAGVASEDLLANEGRARRTMAVWSIMKLSPSYFSTPHR